VDACELTVLARSTNPQSAFAGDYLFNNRRSVRRYRQKLIAHGVVGIGAGETDCRQMKLLSGDVVRSGTATKFRPKMLCIVRAPPFTAAITYPSTAGMFLSGGIRYVDYVALALGWGARFLLDF
jgi:hypothetical protein